MAKSRKRKCGSCKHFMKIRSWFGRIGGCGLCERWDARTDSGYHGCSQFKRIKFLKPLLVD